MQTLVAHQMCATKSTVRLRLMTYARDVQLMMV